MVGRVALDHVDQRRNELLPRATALGRESVSHTTASIVLQSILDGSVWFTWVALACPGGLSHNLDDPDGRSEEVRPMHVVLTF